MYEDFVEDVSVVLVGRDQDVESVPYFNLYQFKAPFIGLVLMFLNYLLLPVEINI